jgi:RIO-like serine/threonine protein kinase
MSGVFGRGGLVQAGGCVLRPYRRGGFVRRFSRATYLSPARFKREYDVHARLWAAGLPTVEPMGYAYRRRRLGFEGVFLTRKTEGLPWPKAWGGECDTSLAETVVDLIKSISAWGLWAPDLNATNFLLTPDGRIIALDWDRARWTAKRCLLESHLKRLERSLLKLDAPPPLLAAVRALGMGGE